MASEQPGGQSQNPAWFRMVRPLLWWVLLVLVLYGIVWHQRTMEITRLNYTVLLAGQPLFSSASAMLDGKFVTSGQRLSLGNHTLTIAHPKTKTLTTNFFVWYGEHNLGALTLERAAGSLAITANPPAQVVNVRGPEWHKELANVASEKVAVPTDEYTVTAIYPYFTVEKTVEVADSQSATCSFTPAVGGLQATFGYSGAGFELRRMRDSQPENRVLERGKLPATVMGLEVGQYQLRATYLGMVENRSLEITASHTNQLEVEFPLGSILIDTMPAGATVSDDQGNDLGVTPLTLNGVPAGNWRGEVNLPDYTTVMVTVNVLAKQTNNFQTKLVRRSFTKAMALSERMHQKMSGDYTPLIEAFSAAVNDDPNNAEAVALLKRARLGQAILDANINAERGDFAGALRAGEAALAIAPENPEAQRLVADFKARVKDQQAKAAIVKLQEAAALRVSRPRDYFSKLMRETPDNADFTEQTIKIPGEVGKIRAKLADALSNSMLLKFAIEENQQPFVEGFLIRCKMSQMNGFRRCYLVGGQTADGEVTIYFKVFEYGWPKELALSAVVNKPSEDQAISINKSTVAPFLLQIRREQGIQMVADRIKSVTR